MMRFQSIKDVQQQSGAVAPANNPRTQAAKEEDWEAKASPDCTSRPSLKTKTRKTEVVFSHCSQNTLSPIVFEAAYWSDSKQGIVLWAMMFSAAYL